MKPLIPLRPENFVSPLTQSEQTALTWCVLSGTSRRDSYLTFARPDLLGSKSKAAVEEHIKQFYSRKEVKEYIEAYQKTMDAILHPQPSEEKPSVSMEEKAKMSMAKVREFAIELANHIEEAEDPEYVVKLLDKLGMLDNGEKVEIAPQRFLGERCSDCRYRVFCEQECEDLCQYCRYRAFGEENGIHYESKEQLDMPNKIGTELAEET